MACAAELCAVERMEYIPLLEGRDGEEDLHDGGHVAGIAEILHAGHAGPEGRLVLAPLASADPIEVVRLVQLHLRYDKIVSTAETK